jgi:hypothetical protein
VLQSLFLHLISFDQISISLPILHRPMVDCPIFHDRVYDCNNRIPHETSGDVIDFVKFRDDHRPAGRGTSAN